MLERLVSGWRHGASGTGGRGKARLAIELPMVEGLELESELKRTESPMRMEGGLFKERRGSGSGSLM